MKVIAVKDMPYNAPGIILQFAPIVEEEKPLIVYLRVLPVKHARLLQCSEKITQI